MNAGIVKVFFERLARVWVPEPVRVELVTLAPSSPMAGAVGWDDTTGAWRILAPQNVGGRDLLFVVFHELRHIVRGDAPRPWTTAQFSRDLMTGRATLGAMLKRQALDDRDAKPGRYRPVEDDADAWAEEQVGRWWPMLEMIERTVKATVDKTMNELLRG